jgi:hypothetical protein
MLLVIDGPVFHGDSDEDHFFEWLAELPSFEKVVGVRTKLEITLREPVDDETALGLIVLCDRWRLDMKPLRGLRSRENEGWFASPQRWFYNQLWGKQPSS